ncbi:MAG: hypothetical protein HN909_01465 [Phycisphaerales bacterium]|nr:hypothetical protein [Phycisphaerales bacterium]MBT7170416.1 hypothetical protein [Phycisphaerales bacterium]
MLVFLSIPSLAHAASTGTIEASINNTLPPTSATKHLELWGYNPARTQLMDKMVVVGPIDVLVKPATATGTGITIAGLATFVNPTESYLLGWGADLATFVDEPIPGYHPYEVHPPVDGPFSLATPWIFPPPGGFPAQRATDLFNLFQMNEAAALSDPDTAIAFQLAIYEILSEASGGYDLMSGDFFLVPDFGPDLHAILANSMLSSLTDVPQTLDLYFLRNLLEKDIIISNTEPPPPVPEPITLTSLGLCLLGAGSYLRRRSKE